MAGNNSSNKKSIVRRPGENRDNRQDNGELHDKKNGIVADQFYDESYSENALKAENNRAASSAKRGRGERSGTVPAKSKASGSSAQVKTVKKSAEGNGADKAGKKSNTAQKKSDSRFSRQGNAALFILFFILLLAIGVFSAFLSYTYLVDRYENPITPESIIIEEDTQIAFKIEKGARTEAIAEALKKQGIIKNKLIFRLLSKFNGYDGTYTSGVHYLCKGLTYDEVMVVLSDEPESVWVTFPEGFTTIQIAERLDASGVVDKNEFLDAVNTIDLSSYTFVPQEKGERDYRLDGFLFPDTYKFEIDSGCDSVIYKMLNRFGDVFKPEYYARAEKLGLSISDVVTIASFVEKEAKVSSEREIIARVYYNRLFSEDLKLMQCDATVQYLVKRNTGEAPAVVTGEMLNIDDKYNTYKYEGLTPGPICSPSGASIQAVIEMNPHDYYYYVLKKDGNGAHVFSKTLEEHEAAVKANR